MGRSNPVGHRSSQIVVCFDTCRVGGALTSPVHATVEHIEISVGSERSFAVVFSIVFTLIGVRPLLSGDAARGWAVFGAVAVLLVGLVFPRLLAVPNRLWCRFGLVIGGVMSQVIMTVIFFLVITPTGLTMRLFRRVSTEHRRSPDTASSTYWISRGRGENPMGSMRNQY